MKTILRLTPLVIFIFLISMATTSCVKELSPIEIVNESDLFLHTNDISIFMEGVVAYKFDPSKHQIAFTEDRSSYMVTNMEQTEYYSLTITSALVLNQKVMVINNVSGIGYIDPNGYTMRILKVVGDKYWLWDEQAQVGLIIDYN